jgi:hypothetical protein
MFFLALYHSSNRLVYVQCLAQTEVQACKDAAARIVYSSNMFPQSIKDSFKRRIRGFNET